MIAQEIAPRSKVTVTPQAKNRLASWGLQDRTIEQLVSLTGSFDYSARGNVSRIPRLYTHEIEGRPFILVPGIFDPYGTGPGGDCTSIASHFHFTAEVSGLADRIRDEATKDLLLTHTNGKSREFFAHSHHVWNTLLPKKNQEEKIGFLVDPKEGVVFDGSFREISTIPENGYRTRQSIAVQTRGVNGAVHADVMLVNAYTAESGKLLGVPNFYKEPFPVLGISDSRQRVYSLKFGKTDRRIIPLLASVEADSTTTQSYYLNVETGELCTLQKDSQTLSPEDALEILEILERLATLPLEPAPEILRNNQEITRNFR
ncbi:MAG: hypothetical protein Q8Q49_04515 [bacterium]|nr:hypothetical protein [bacterium]